MPRLTDDDRDNLNLEATAGPESPARGLMIFNTDNECVEFWSGTRWISLCVDALPPPTCGSNGIPLLVRIGENYYYTHYFMTNNGVNRCWMVQNSREGEPNNLIGYVGNSNATGIWNRHPAASSDGERGFYYVWQTAQDYACPSGWIVPSVLEFNELRNIVNPLIAAGSGINCPSRFWIQEEHLAGSRFFNGTWFGWGVSSSWWTDDTDPSARHVEIYSGMSVPSLSQTAAVLMRGVGRSVRCIRDE